LIVLSITGLRNLETLYLDSNDFMESILIESLGALPSLKTLDASYSNFKHFGKGQWQFWCLKQYDIYIYYFDSWIYLVCSTGLCNSSSLEEVVLDGSSLPASFLRNIGPLSTLKVLSLAGVDFNSTLPAQGN
jgi:Leucine-rich repeat (LRR) protein